MRAWINFEDIHGQRYAMDMEVIKAVICSPCKQPRCDVPTHYLIVTNTNCGIIEVSYQTISKMGSLGIDLNILLFDESEVVKQ